MLDLSPTDSASTSVHSVDPNVPFVVVTVGGLPAGTPTPGVAETIPDSTPLPRIAVPTAAVAADPIRGRVHRADVPPRPGPGVRDDPGERATDGGGGPACRGAERGASVHDLPSGAQP